MVAAGSRRNDVGTTGEQLMRAQMVIALVAALAACDRGEVDEKNATPAEVAEAVAKSGADMKFLPGRWESQVSFVSMNAPGMPPEVSQAMQGSVGKDQRYATCLSKAEAEKPAADFFAKDAQDCTYDHFTLGDGKIDAAMKCGARGGGTGAVAMTMTGTYDRDSYAMAMNTRVDGGAGGPMTMTMKVSANHAGACRGDESGTN